MTHTTPSDFFTISQQIGCVRREIALRERVFPIRVRDGKMKQEQCDYEIAAMKAVLQTLLNVQSRP